MTLRRVFRNECARLVHEESGVAVVFTLCSFLFLFACCTSVWFVGENVRRKAELQNACDAAAYSAAVVQADGLSRMAVVNRAMSWCYVQMTKMQMDYITLRWLELTKERFEKDRRNADRTDDYRKNDPIGASLAFSKIFGNKAAFWSLQDFWHGIGGELLEHLIDFPPYLVLKGGFSCKERTHSDPNDAKGNGSYIGFRGMFSGADDHIGCVRLNAGRTRELDSDGTYVPVQGGDFGVTGASGASIDQMLEELHDVYGDGSVLSLQIRAMKTAIVTCNALLPSINRQMGASIEKTAVRTLFENLPRDENGLVDGSILNDFRWTVFGGASRPPREYSSGLGSLSGISDQMCLASKPYFSGLHNTEEDEILFLNMADGLPEVYGGGKSKEIRLIDYFADRSGSSYALPASVKGLCPGLDQWFIRCDPRESAISDQIVVERNFAKTRGGIVRAYKNANYDEGSSGASLLQKNLLAGFGSGIHRGNYVSELGEDLRNEISSRVFNPLKAMATDKKPSDYIVIDKKRGRKRPPSWTYIKNRAKRRAQELAKKTVAGMFDEPVKALLSPFANLIKKADNLAGNFLDNLTTLDVEPSCKNERMRFIDKCANTRDTTGLVSEWEWASAYWGCHWISIHVHIWPVNYDYEYCSHPFVPMAALHGGTKGSSGATDSYVENWGNEWVMLPLQWIMPELRMFTGEKGKKRAGKVDKDGYRSTFISLDTDIPQSCSYEHSPPAVGWTYGGKRSNFLFKGFSRVYGDDAEIYDDNYQGVPCQPWVLDKSFFHGAGSIVVGVSRKQTNFFADLFDDLVRKADVLDKRSLYSAFTPADERQHFVALAAGRAGWAPRRGGGRADGSDSVNSGLNPARWFELRFDSVLDKKLGPQGRPSLPRDIPGLDEDVARHLEEHGRIGCVCGTPNTTARLRRQWNLSQTDWDGVLLPLRYALAAHETWDSAMPVYGGRGSDELSDWKFSFLGTRSDASASVAGVLWDNAVWRPFALDNEWGSASNNPDPDGPLKTRDILPLPVGRDDKTAADLIRKRRLL